MKIYGILHNIRSIENVGSLFRTADGAGIAKLFLTGYTPAPTDRFGRVVLKMKKTALGATESVPYEAISDIGECIEMLRSEGVYIVAVEQHPRAVSYTDFSPQGDVAYILGNEIDGVPMSVCESADTVVHIPMHGSKESLNVGVAGGIVLFHAVSSKN